MEIAKLIPFINGIEINKERALTAKVKQEMIDEVITTELYELGLEKGNTKETSISLENDEDGNAGEWITMGKYPGEQRENQK